MPENFVCADIRRTQSYIAAANVARLVGRAASLASASTLVTLVGAQFRQVFHPRYYTHRRLSRLQTSC